MDVSAFFDWYSATVPGADPRQIDGALVEAFPGTAWEPCRPEVGYDLAQVLRDDDQAVCELHSGGANRSPHVRAKGSHRVEEVAAFLREEFMPHNVTRADSAIDVVGPGLFDELDAILVEHARRHGLRIDQRGDWVRGFGRTRYIGSRSSPVYLRMYEKGHQTGGDPGWVRLEVEVKPVKDAKAELAHRSAAELWFAGLWISELSRELDLFDLQRFTVGTVREPSDYDRARAWLMAMYAPTLRRILDEAGDEHVAPVLRRHLEAHRAASPGDRRLFPFRFHQALARLDEDGGT